MVLLTNCQLTDLLLTKLVALVFFSTRLATLVYLITHNKAMGYLLIFHSEPEIIYAVLGTYLFLDICLFLGSFIKTKWIFIVWQIAALLWVMISILEIFFHETFRDFILGLLSIILRKISTWPLLKLLAQRTPPSQKYPRCGLTICDYLRGQNLFLKSLDAVVISYI